MAAEVKMYSTSYCPYCTQAKGLLKKRNIAFEEIDVTNDPEKRAWLVQTTGRRTVPQIFIGDEPIGGSDELHALDRKGLLMPKIEGSAKSA